MSGAGSRVLVVGAGPGGLAAAAAFRRRGIRVRVFEGASRVGGEGSALTLWANALSALDRIGLGDAVRARGRLLAGIEMRTRGGRTLFRLDGSLARAFGDVGVALHRDELLDALLDGAGDDRVVVGRRCTGFRLEEAGVAARFADGTVERGELLVGADGLHSTVRRAVVGDGSPRYAGYTVWRGVTRHPLPEAVGTTTMGRGAQFGAFPMARDRVYWFASENAPAGETEDPASTKARLLRRFGSWHPPIPRLIESTPARSILRNDASDRDPRREWGDGPVTLLGDAAHPSTPALGQGAGQAIEDGVVLAGCLAGAGDPVRALRRYELRRRGRANAMTVQSRLLGRMGQWESPLACRLRNAAIRVVPDGLRMRQLRWMFAFDG